MIEPAKYWLPKAILANRLLYFFNQRLSQAMRRSHLFLLVMLVLGLVLLNTGVFKTVETPGSGVTTGPAARHLGFWIDERSIFNGGQVLMTPQQFFNGYFLTPPYPAALLFALGFVSGAPISISQKDAWLSSVAKLGDAYPNIEIDLLCFVNLTDTSQVANLQSVISTLSGYSSIKHVEYEREYYGNTQAQLQSFKTILDQNQIPIMLDPSQRSYFSGQNLPILNYAEFPWFQSSDSAEAAIYQTPLSSEIGKLFGEYAQVSNFPVSCILPADSNLAANPPCNGWNQQVVQAIVDESLKVSTQNRQLTYIAAGFVNQSQAFLGVSGISTRELWDNPTFRSWIWSDPNYVNNYVLSTTLPTTSSITIQTTSSIGNSGRLAVTSSQPLLNFNAVVFLACVAGGYISIRYFEIRRQRKSQSQTVPSGSTSLGH